MLFLFLIRKFLIKYPNKCVSLLYEKFESPFYKVLALSNSKHYLIWTRFLFLGLCRPKATEKCAFSFFETIII